MKVLLMTIQNPPPTLETDAGNKHFSKAMRDIVAKCLVKDPSKRPSAAQLLDHKFFKVYLVAIRPASPNAMCSLHKTPNFSLCPCILMSQALIRSIPKLHFVGSLTVFQLAANLSL